MMRRFESTVLIDQQFKLGENPLWDDRCGELLWTDITAGRLWRWIAATGRHQCLYEGDPVGGFTLQEDGSLLLFRVTDIASIERSGRVLWRIPFVDEDAERFNDVIATPDGSVLAGTIGRTESSGGLYHVTSEGRVRRLFGGTGISNGMGISPDLSALYWTCSTQRKIWRFSFDADSATLGERTLFWEGRAEEGTPDGLTVDAEGRVWSARWGGWQVVGHGCDGVPTAAVAVPCERVSSMTFGGDGYDRMFITAAGGGVYACSAGVRGQREHRSRVEKPIVTP